MKKVVVECPKCGSEQKVEMPKDQCLAFYKCDGCEEMIGPKKNDCCVICSYSDEKCEVSQK